MDPPSEGPTIAAASFTVHLPLANELCSNKMTQFFNKISTLFGSSSSNSVASTASRSVARERLSVILASQRGSEILLGVDMVKFQNDVMEVVRKHIKLAKSEPVSFQVKQEGNVNLFEMQVELDKSKITAESASKQN